MGLGEKIRRALRKMKGRLIIYAVAVVVGIFAIVAPISRAVTDGINVAAETGNQTEGIQTFFYHLVYITEPGENIQKVFTQEYFGNFMQGVWIFLLIAVFFAIIGIIPVVKIEIANTADVFNLYDFIRLVKSVVRKLIMHFYLLLL